MQRRNVDLPEPDGPSRHITSPGCTSSVMPFSTSRRPKRLCTASALTIGVAHRPGGRMREQALRAAARAGPACARARAAPVAALEVVLADVQHASCTTRYQMLADDQQRDRLEVDRVDELRRVEQLGRRRSRSTSEVVFSIEIVSLPVGGMITRIACGSTIRRIVCRRVMPSACAASAWPSSTEMIPARTISAM